MTDGDQKLAALEKALLDESADPVDLPFSLLTSITGNFSESQEIGSGGFGAVYRGVLPSGRTIAVKKLFEKFEILDKNFKSEVACLIRVKHKNTVRFLGHCSEAQQVLMPYEGKLVCAEERHRLLCFEYLPKGCLADYLSDASCRLQWTTCYEIIKGICEGVHYLHQQRIIHMDLKPQNVLLDDNMVPRIADFGLSRRLSESKSRAITKNMIGTKGYMAPEFLIRGEITFKTDIYSLGVIIMEILMGHKDCSSVKEVVESWMDMFGTSKSETSLEQVKACAEIGIECTNYYPRNRPATWFIIHGILGEAEISNWPVTSDISFASKLADELKLMDHSAAAPSQLPPSMLEVEQEDGKVNQERKRKTSNISFLKLADELKLMDNSIAPSQLHDHQGPYCDRSQCFQRASHSGFKRDQPTAKQPDGIRKTKRSKGPVKPTTISCTQLGVNESQRDIVKAVEVNRKEQHSLSVARQLLEQLRMYSADSSESSDEDITNGAPRSWPDVGKEPSTGLPFSLPHGTNEPGCSSEGIISGQNSHFLVWDAQINEVAAVTTGVGTSNFREPVTRSMCPLSISKGIHSLDGKQVSQDQQTKPHQSPPMRCRTLAHAEIASASREPATLNNGNSVSLRSSVTCAVTRSMSPLAISKWKGSCHGKGNAESQEQLENIAQSTLKSQENVTTAVTASSSMEPAGTSDTNQEHTPQHNGHKTEIRSNTNQSAAIFNDSSISRQLNFDSAESERASQCQHLIADCPSLDLSINGTPADVNHKPDNVTGMSGTQVERIEAIPEECIAPTDPLVISSSDDDEVLLIPIQAIWNSSPDEDYIAMSQPKDSGMGGVDDSVEIVTTKLSNTRHIAPFSFDRGSTSTTTPIVAQGSNTPVPQPHQKRAVRAGKMQKFVVSEHTRRLYDAVCRYAKKSPPIKDETIIIDFGSYFIYLYDLADSVEPEGKLSNSTCEIALHILKQEMLPERKFVMPLRITQYLAEGSLKHKELEKIFKFSQSNHLDESEQIMFPRMLTLPHDENNKNKHCYLIVLNLKAKRFEVLDSLNLEMQPIMIEDCNRIVTSIRNCWATKYSQPSTGIQDYPIEHVDVPQQQTRYDCGYFMLKYIELWDGRNVTYYFKQSDMPNIRMLYTEKWLNWEQNKVKHQTLALLSMESDS